MGFHMTLGTMGRDGQWDYSCMWTSFGVEFHCPMVQCDGMDSGTTVAYSRGLVDISKVPWYNGTGWTVGPQLYSRELVASHGIPHIPWYNGTRWTVGQLYSRGLVDVPWDSTCPMVQWDRMDSGTAAVCYIAGNGHPMGFHTSHGTMGWDEQWDHSCIAGDY